MTNDNHTVFVPDEEVRPGDWVRVSGERRRVREVCEFVTLAPPAFAVAFFVGGGSVTLIRGEYIKRVEW